MEFIHAGFLEKQQIYRYIVTLNLKEKNNF
jgi:hypothetical protein